MSPWHLLFHQYSGVHIVLLLLGICLKQAAVLMDAPMALVCPFSQAIALSSGFVGLGKCPRPS